MTFKDDTNDKDDGNNTYDDIQDSDIKNDDIDVKSKSVTPTFDQLLIGCNEINRSKSNDS